MKIAILASGSGSNAEQIIKYFKGHHTIEVSLVLSNNKNAFVLERAKKLNVESAVFHRSQFYKTGEVNELLEKNSIDYIVLAGFLWLIPSVMIKNYQQKIINIHPSLLPKYGGKGMYGSHVHQAVIDHQEIESGITIHLVDEIYDNGKILAQYKTGINQGDTPDSLATKIHKLEHEYFSKTIESFVLDNTNTN